jgi:hypothetical protein
MAHIGSYRSVILLNIFVKIFLLIDYDDKLISSNIFNNFNIGELIFKARIKEL